MKILDENIIRETPLTASIYDPAPFRHRHNFFEIAFGVRGQCTNVINDKPLPFQRGVCVILRPDDWHYFKDVPEKPFFNYKHKDVYVEPDKFERICRTLLPNLYEDILSADYPPVYQIPDACVVVQAETLDLFYTDISRPVLDAFPTAVVTELLSFYLRDKLHMEKNLPKWLDTLLRSLNSLETMILSVSELAKKVGYTPEHLSREFKKYMGKPLSQYLTETKIRYSVQLLTSRQLKIIDIAQLLGYENQSTFSSHFRAIYQCTPSQYLKEKFSE